MSRQKIRPLVFIILFVISCSHTEGVPQQIQVKTGAAVLIEEHLEELKGFRVGLVMNPTARIGDVHMIDTLLALDVNITALFAPEHGFRGEAGDGEIIEGGIDRATGLPVHSLYGETRKPSGSMLEDVDLLLFDMQDVGARFYTYNSTLGLLLESASEFDVDVWLLDRPNPAGGDYVAGWVMEEDYFSFVGMYPIPVAHGMTLGELGLMMIGEKWINADPEPDFRVIEMQGWDRAMKWPHTGLPWVPPSPNLPSFEHAYAYLGTCFVEGTTLSEGRGTDHPFLTLGSPETAFTDTELASLRQRVPGAELQRVEFIPREIPGRAINPKHEGEVSTGIRIQITDYDSYDPLNSGLQIVTFLLSHSEEAEILPYMYQLAGSAEVGGFDRFLRPGEGNAVHHGDVWWEFDTEDFEELREQYLLY